MRLKRGSTTISFALRCFFASITHLKPQGALQRVAAHHPDEVGVLEVNQWLVIAPRPKLGARLATVGACQMRAWVSSCVTPSARSVLTVRYPPSLVAADEAASAAKGRPTVHRHAILVLRDEILVAVRLHVLGDALDRVVPGNALPLVGAGLAYFRPLEAILLCIMSRTPAPFGHSVPRFTGLSGSPST